MKEDKVLILVRGLPGSGKTSFAKLLGGLHLEADMFFEKNGEYLFDKEKIEDAHSWCRDECEKAMLSDEPKIVISNTFTREWEMITYEFLAEEHDYTVHHVIVENRHKSQNIHGCPEETIEKMRVRFDIKL